LSQNSNRHGLNRSVGCYVVEEVVGGTISTTWDKEEARQLANSRLLSGKDTENSLAIRRVSCSKLPPPIDEKGVSLRSIDSRGHKALEIRSPSVKCKENQIATIGFCIERIDPPERFDISSVTRKKRGDHYVVLATEHGSWDPLHRRYLNRPFVFEIWHPADETTCKLTNLDTSKGSSSEMSCMSRAKLAEIKAGAS
jgi:hypothetical protein